MVDVAASLFFAVLGTHFIEPIGYYSLVRTAGVLAYMPTL